MFMAGPGGASEYYTQKSHLGVSDEYYERISETDIQMMQKSLGIIIVAPFATVVVMYLAKKVKKDTAQSEKFLYRIRGLQDTLVSSNYRYQRSADAPEPQVSGKRSQEEAVHLKNLYEEIKEDEVSL